MSRYLTLSLALSVILLASVATSGAPPTPGSARAQPNLGKKAADTLERELARRMEGLRHEWGAGRTSVDRRGYPGITFAYCLPDGRCNSLAVGYSDLGNHVPMRGDDRMLAGSIGKTFAAAVIMQLVEEGKLRLDDPISNFLKQEPWFSRLGNAPDITVRMLLSHRSGIGGSGNVIQPAASDFRKNHQRVWSYLDRLPLDQPAKFPAGTKFEYRDENYDLVALIIEKVTGDTYYTEVNRRVLIPLHLDGTYPQNNPSQRHLPGVVDGYQQRDDSMGLGTDISTNGTFVVSPSYEWGGGGFVSNSLDLAYWARILYGGRMLKDATLSEMVADASTFAPTERYGLGVTIYETPWGNAYGHTGYMTGFRSAMLYVPKYDLALALQTNTDYIVASGTSHHMEAELLLRALSSLTEVIAARSLQW